MEQQVLVYNLEDKWITSLFPDSVAYVSNDIQMLRNDASFKDQIVVLIGHASIPIGHMVKAKEVKSFSIGSGFKNYKVQTS